MTLNQHLQKIRIDGRDTGLVESLMAYNLPIDDLDDPGREFFRFRNRAETVGYGGLETHGEHALLRSLVVLPHQRRKGHGNAIAQGLLEHAGRSGVQAVYLLTQDAAAFFERMGFSAQDRQEAPPAILATRQAASLCPASAILLVKILRR